MKIANKGYFFTFLQIFKVSPRAHSGLDKTVKMCYLCQLKFNNLSPYILMSIKKIGLLLSLCLIVGGVFMSSVKPVHAGYVKGYYRSNGTYVAPYYRSNANALKYDNYSYTGGSLYNTSYTSPTRSYTSSWYTPSWNTQSNYYLGRSYYNTSHYTYYSYLNR